MTRITRSQKLYFAAIGLLAVWVGIWGFFVPEHVDKAIPWLVPPLHARFIGAIYFSAVVLMGVAMLATSYDEVRIPVFITTVWTGALFIISLFYLSEFDFKRGPVWFWFAAYIAYPLIGLWLTWTHWNARDTSAPSLPAWIRNVFLIEGLILTLLALTLLLMPDFMLNLWPWKITRMLAQIYSGPFLAYGLSMLILSRQRTWREVRILAMALVILSIGVLLASSMHKALFISSNPATWIWFGGFALILIIHLCMFPFNRKEITQ